MTKQQLRTKHACFLTSFATAFTGNLAPLLFLSFRNMYGISYSLLGLLVVINFGTQLLCDLIFSFFSAKLPVRASLKLMPAVIAVGMALFGLAPYIFPDNVYLGLALGTVISSVGSGLSEVLTNPVVAALPSDNSERLLSRLHSCYAWGVVVVVVITTLYLHICGAENWMWLFVLCACLPLAAFILIVGADIPDIAGDDKAESDGGLSVFKKPVLWLCVLCIFLGGASECTMSQWCSAYLEQAFGLPKAVGDLGGVALFGAMLALGRTLYSKFGRNAETVLLIGSCGAFACYITAVFSPVPLVGLLGCALTGFCVSMLWPGSLIVTGDLLPHGGVAMFAIMAAGGDLGASVCPQLVGLCADAVILRSDAAALAEALSLTAEQLAMKSGLAIASLFPLAAVLCFYAVRRIKRKSAK